MIKVRIAASKPRIAFKATGVIVLAVGLLVDAAGASPAHANALTFQAAIARAQANAPSLQAKALGVSASRAARGAAGALPDPKLSLGVDSFPISGPLAFKPSQDNFTWVRVGISQDIPNPAKRKAQRTRANADIAVAEADTLLEARNVEVDSAVAWITLAYAEKRLAVANAVRSKLERLVRTTPEAVASGNARPGQTIAGRLSLAQIDDRRDDLISAIGRARADLTRWTGDTEPSVTGPIPEFPVDGSSLQASLDSNPQLAPVRARIDQANADVRIARADRKSDFGVEASYQHRNRRFGDYVSAGVTIGLPFFTRGRQNALIAARQAEVEKVAAEQDAARRQLVASLASSLADHAMHHAQWIRARGTSEPLARERVALETASYGAGRATLVDVVDAYAALIEAALTTIDREALVKIDGAKLTLTYGSASR